METKKELRESIDKLSYTVININDRLWKLENPAIFKIGEKVLVNRMLYDGGYEHEPHNYTILDTRTVHDLVGEISREYCISDKIGIFWIDIRFYEITKIK